VFGLIIKILLFCLGLRGFLHNFWLISQALSYPHRKKYMGVNKCSTFQYRSLIHSDHLLYIIAKWLAFLLHILEVLVLHLGLDNAYSDRVFMFFSAAPERCQNN
jgi:hypothetical protein